MADRISAVDPAVDELRRKARRRLVGAIVLALAAAVILPMLLEKEPRPLGEDVAVRIPPVDDGKFVNRLSGNAAKDASPSTAPAPAPSKSSTEPSPGTGASTPAVSPKAAPNVATPAAPTSAQPTTEPAPAPPVTAPAKPEPPTASAPAASPAQPGEAKSAASEPKSNAKTASPKSGSAEGAFVVQLAAFSDDKGANALASKLKRNGYPAYTEAVQTSRGTLYRVRVGGYASREAAGDARNKLKGDGYAGIVAQAH